MKSTLLQRKIQLLTEPHTRSKSHVHKWSGAESGLSCRLLGSYRWGRAGLPSRILIERENVGPMTKLFSSGIENSPTTLEDVLYPNTAARNTEQEWVTLVESIAAGDQLALHALYQRSHRVVFTLIMRITANRETAEEVTIDVFHDIWRRASHYDAVNGTVLGWIMNQARSRAIDRLRFESRKKRSPTSNMETLADVAADPRDVVHLREQSESLHAVLATLSPNEREAIETTFFAGLTHAEAAARLNQPLGTIKTRIRSGLQKLRDALIERGMKA